MNQNWKSFFFLNPYQAGEAKNKGIKPKTIRLYLWKLCVETVRNCNHWLIRGKRRLHNWNLSRKAVRLRYTGCERLGNAQLQRLASCNYTCITRWFILVTTNLLVWSRKATPWLDLSVIYLVRETQVLFTLMLQVLDILCSWQRTGEHRCKRRCSLNQILEKIR